MKPNSDHALLLIEQTENSCESGWERNTGSGMHFSLLLLCLSLLAGDALNIPGHGMLVGEVRHPDTKGVNGLVRNKCTEYPSRRGRGEELPA